MAPPLTLTRDFVSIFFYFRIEFLAKSQSTWTSQWFKAENQEMKKKVMRETTAVCIMFVDQKQFKSFHIFNGNNLQL